MAVMVVLNWPGVSKEQYDAARGLVKWETDAPKGGMLHVSAFDEGGSLRVVDVWESAEDFQSFVDNRLMPGTASLNLPGQPNVQVYPVHAVFAPNIKTAP
jgi:hypothetical protein